MKVLHCSPVKNPAPKDTVAFVDFELNEHIRLYGLRLLRQPDGAHYLFAPHAGNKRTATFSRPLAKHLTALAVEALEAAK